MIVKQSVEGSKGLSRLLRSALIDPNRVVGCKVIHLTETIVCFCAADVWACVSIHKVRQSFCTYTATANSRFCYMVKPHEQLVLVSSTPRSASTPNLST